LALHASSENRLAVSGAVCCLVSALTYTVSNICMRELTVLRCDPIWAVFNRELVTTIVIGPWLLYQTVGRRMTWPVGRGLAGILSVGLLIEIVGNVGVQWALGIVGLAVTTPAIFGVTIAGGALLAWMWLGEPVSLRSMAAISLLLAALALLGIGAESVGSSTRVFDADAPGPLLVALAVAASGLAGATYALLNIAIRHSVTRTTSPGAVALLVPLMGVVGLGPLCVGRLGMQELLSTPWEQWALMAAAGVFNLVGFLALIHGLQRTTVIHANVVSASQVAMAAAAGMALFHEPPNPWLLLGIGLTIGGILWVDRPADGGML
jgi:DME family drug/metabolite transporter